MFTALQSQMLEAMGYTLYQRPTPFAAVHDEASPSDVAQDSSAQIETKRSGLSAAIAHAARGKDISALSIDIRALQRSAEAKRQLWRQIRRLLSE